MNEKEKLSLKVRYQVINVGGMMELDNPDFCIHHGNNLFSCESSLDSKNLWVKIQWRKDIYITSKYPLTNYLLQRGKLTLVNTPLIN